MPELVHCTRCNLEAPRLEKPPLRGAVGELVQEKVCPSCWSEWEKAEVMVINELRLNFMDPGAPAALEQQMREFLFLGPALE